MSMTRDGAVELRARDGLGTAVLKALIAANSSNALQSRFAFGGQSQQEDRDFDRECKYPTTEELTPNWYREKYGRWGLAARCVDIWPDESWAVYPEVYETEDPKTTPFEDAWNDLNERVLACHYLHRADRLSGIGRFGVIFLGLDDGGRLDGPPAGFDRYTGEPTSTDPPRYKVNYLRALDESVVRVTNSDSDPRSPRNGRPTYYSVQFASSDVGGPGELPGGGRPPGDFGGPGGAQGRGSYLGGKGVTPGDGKTYAPSRVTARVHWTRMIHLADNRLTSEVYGEPRLKKVADYLHDARKVAGSSAEMFYKGGFPGYAFEQFPDQFSEIDLDPESLRQQINLYQKGLQRYLATMGGRWSSLSPQVADPNNHLDWYVKLIATTLGVPIKIFLGTESGHLASSQDANAWRTRLMGRQVRYLTPMVLRPFVDRLVTLGALPPPSGGQYKIAWRDLRSLSDGERADVALKRMQALGQYYTNAVNQGVALRSALTMVMGMTEDEAQSVIDEQNKNPTPVLLPMAPAGAAPAPGKGGQGGGGRSGKPFKNKTGRKPGSVEKV